MDIINLQEILNSFKWIKVKKYSKSDNDDIDYHSEYERLEDHHKKETEFLINKCRELANELLVYKYQER